VAAGLEVARAVYKQLESFKQAQRSGYNPNRLQRDLPAYIAAASSFSIDHGDVGDFTEGILGWWKSHATEVGAWDDVALIAFAMAKKSAGAERVFSLLKILFGNNQDTAIADYIRGSMCSTTTTPSALVRLASEYVYLRRGHFKKIGSREKTKRKMAEKWPKWLGGKSLR
jgi:hypothetical protein